MSAKKKQRPTFKKNNTGNSKRKNMKKILVITVLMVTLTGAKGQDVISKFFSKYQQDESFTNVNISSKMFGLFTEMDAESPEDKEVLEAISKLKGLKILAKENARNSRELYKEAIGLIPRNFEELMSVRDKDKDVKFMIDEQGGKISEMLMIVGGNEEFMIMSIFGEIDLKQISRIGSRMNIKGLENLKNMDKKNDKGTGDNSRERKNE
jgi:CII-binding regulator of phage lambda lysogenization HflD